MTKCPKCETQLSCPCKSCVAGREAHNIKATKWTEPKDGIIGCPKCGFEAHEDYWTDLELKQLEDKEEGFKNKDIGETMKEELARYKNIYETCQKERRRGLERESKLLDELAKLKRDATSLNFMLNKEIERADLNFDYGAELKAENAKLLKKIKELENGN